MCLWVNKAPCLGVGCCLAESGMDLPFGYLDGDVRSTASLGSCFHWLVISDLEMTSATLITFLRGLDYDTRGLRADQFSVVCNDRALRRFFEFLLTNVSKEKNLVDSDELKRYAVLWTFVLTRIAQCRFQVRSFEIGRQGACGCTRKASMDRKEAVKWNRKRSS